MIEMAGVNSDIHGKRNSESGFWILHQVFPRNALVLTVIGDTITLNGLVGRISY